MCPNFRVGSWVSRRWCLPPAIVQGPDERLEGVAILLEIPGELGFLLWRTAQDLRLWAEAPPEARAHLFAEHSGDQRLATLATTDVPAAISKALGTLAGMLAEPARADADVLMICCLEVAAWARREGLAKTVVEFAQAGALASPHFAEPALQTAIAALAAGQDARARTWLHRAVTLARREADRPAYVAALLELAAICERGEDARGAAHYYRRAYRSSRGGGAGSGARMRAAHGLLRVFRSRDPGKAMPLALAGLRACRPDTPDGALFLLDLAGFWMEMEEDARAAAVLRRLAPRRSSLPLADQLASAALTARVLTGEPDRGGRLVAQQDAWRLLADASLPRDVRYRAALDLAHAARSAGDLTSFTNAKRAILHLAPQDSLPRVRGEIAAVWPEGERAPALECAS